MEKNRIIRAFVFTLMACNTVFAEACDVPPEWPNIIFEGASTAFILPDFRTWQQSPWDIGATSEDSVFAEFSPDGTLIIRGRGNMMDFEIDSPWKTICEEKNKLSKVFIENGVTHIGNEAFIYCNDLTIAIPSSVTSIGTYAFFQSRLSSITIPSSVTSIGVQAFSLSNLSSITIPNSVTYIGKQAFYNNNLSSVTIPNSVTSIGEEAFSNNKSLKTINVASDNKAYSSKDGVLYDKNFSTLIQYPGGQSEDFTIPEGVTSIGKYAFYKSNLTSITIPNSMTSIEEQVLSYIENLKTINVASDNNAYSSKDGVLYDKNFSTLIKYPVGQSGVFTIPDGVTSIEEKAFYNSKLTSITIPASVTYIGKLAFYKELTSITILNPVPPLLCDEFIRFVRDEVNKKTCILYVPKGSVDAYRKANVWKDFKNIEAIE